MLEAPREALGNEGLTIFETRKGFSELGAKVTISYTELDRRLRTLEDVVSDLRTRLDRLESTSTH